MTQCNRILYDAIQWDTMKQNEITTVRITQQNNMYLQYSLKS
jgi:hypothetical protein